MKKKNTLNFPKSAAMGIVSQGLKNEFEAAVVNESSWFEPLKFYCISDSDKTLGVNTDIISLLLNTFL